MMNHCFTRKITKGILSLGVGALSTSSFGWGSLGHALIAREGARTASQNLSSVGHKEHLLQNFEGIQGLLFWSANADNMAFLTNVPDNRWKRQKGAAAESFQHWFHRDHYSKSAAQMKKFPRNYERAVEKYGEDEVHENGTAPWRIQQFYDGLVAALRKQDFREALIMAGILSHYVGDLSQPLHVSENYDGQLTGNKGVHAFFETTLIREHHEELLKSVPQRAQTLLRQKSFRQEFEGSLLESVFRMIERAYRYKDEIIESDRRNGRGAEGQAQLLPRAEERLADGLASLALILDRAWRESGLDSDFGQTMRIEAPAWIPPDFIQGQMSFIEYLNSDDCY